MLGSMQSHHTLDCCDVGIDDRGCNQDFGTENGGQIGLHNLVNHI